MPKAKPSSFDELNAAFAKVNAAHETKCESIEAEFLKNAGIKPEDLYPPEEAARRFNAVMSIMGNTPPLKTEQLKTKAKTRRAEKGIKREKWTPPTTEALEAKAAALLKQSTKQAEITPEDALLLKVQAALMLPADAAVKELKAMLKAKRGKPCYPMTKSASSTSNVPGKGATR